MKNALIASIFVLTSVVGFQACVDRNSGGLSYSSLVSYSTLTIEEAETNDGTFDAEIGITLTGTEFVPSLTKGEEYDITSLPDGLTATFTRTSSTKGTLAITGVATDHSVCSGFINASFFFTDLAFVDGKRPLSFEVPIKIKFINPKLTYDVTSLTENTLNIGTFTQTITITASNGGSFANAGETLAEDTDYVWEDLPEGLTSEIEVDPLDDTIATVTFTGSATDNLPSDDVFAYLKFLSPALSDDFCASDQKQKISFKMYRSIIMYSVPVLSGAFGDRSAADAICYLSKPTMPTEYDGVSAFVSYAGDEVADLPLPGGVKVESAASLPVAPNAAALFSGGLTQTLDAADVIASGDTFFTGSTDTGTVSTNCNNWTSADGGDVGEIGLDSATNGTWLDNGDAPCDTADASIICVEYIQP